MPPFVCDCPSISKIEIDRPKAEYAVYSTTLENDQWKYLKFFDVQDNELYGFDYKRNVGTTIISDLSFIALEIMKDNFYVNYADNFDVFVRLPVKVSLTRKMIIKRITEYKPKIVL